MSSDLPGSHQRLAEPLWVRRKRSLAVGPLLVLGDMMAIALACGVAGGFYAGILGMTAEPGAFLLLLGLLCYPVAYACVGLYPAYGLGPIEQLRTIFISSTVVSLILLPISMYPHGLYSSMLILVLLTWVAVVMVVPLVRGLARTFLVRTEWWGEPLLVLGTGRTAEVLITNLRENPGLGLRPVGCLDDAPEKHGLSCGGVLVLGPLTCAHRLASIHRIRSVIVAMPGLTRDQMLQVVSEYGRIFERFYIVPDLLGLTSSRVSSRDLSGILGLEVRQHLRSPSGRFLKRAMDIVIAAPVLIMAAPLIGIAGLTVKWMSPGPAFYYQEREGFNGRRIRVWKIRTMVPDAEAVLERHLAENQESRQEWQQFMKLRNDPRIIPVVGHFLRRFSVDELPQLWNVVRGDMSLVGPRPFPDYHLQQFSPQFRRLRSQAVPGLTGLWQVTARSTGGLDVQEALDTYYVQNWSLWLDIYVLARTTTTVFFGKGAY